MRALRSQLGLLGTLALTCLPSPAGAQAVGSEFQVNTYTTSNQVTGFTGNHLVAGDAGGNFVVVWRSNLQDGSNEGIFGQRFDSAGEALGSEFRVNSYTTYRQLYASAAASADGNFVVVWDSQNQDGSSFESRGGSSRGQSLWNVFGQRYDSAGAAQGEEFLVNSYTTSTQRLPSVASDASGDFVVVWMGLSLAGSYGIYGQRYDTTGTPQGQEFQVTAGSARLPSVASDASGNFVVAWESLGDGGGDGSGSGIFAQRFDSAGNALGGFRVNSVTLSAQIAPSIASDASGNFVVVWSSNGQDDSGYGVFGQRYDSTGATRGSEFRVNSYTTGSQYFPSVASDASGNFVVAWISQGQDGSGLGIFGQRYDNTGVARGAEFQINTFTTGTQNLPSVGAAGSNQFVVAWDSLGQDGSGYGVFGQRFAVPPSLSISDVSVTEGSSKTKIFTYPTLARFTVTLSAPSALPVTTSYATANGTAMAPSDYSANSATLTLSPGQTSAVIYVEVKKDNLNENDETFFVNLSNPTNATIADAQGVGTIMNDDP